MSRQQQQSASSVSSRSSRNSARIVAQTTVDARLDADFEEHGTSFDYSQTVKLHSGNNNNNNNNIHDVDGTDTTSRRSEKVTAYLQQIQRGKLIQPFGCLVAIDDRTMKVVAYSENAPDMLTSVTHAVPSVGDHGVLSFGSDLRSVFTSPSVAALHKAFAFGDVSLLNPVLVHCRGSGRPFYAVLHRVTGCLVADLEPVKPSELPMTAAGALQSYKLAAKAISKLQSLPGGSLRRLCDAVVQEVLELTGYDRVMAYRFHDDDHGEVFAEVTKPGLEPYQGLHYPATDIPQAARFLFMKNKVRMICDCRARPVRVLQDASLPSDLTFCGSTLRAPHSCHLQYMENMGSIASLVMAVVVNEDEEESEDASSQQQQQRSRKKLWGLVVCHHTSPRFVPFPLRYACEFLTQVFAIHVGKELELEQQAREKTILRTQTVLCDMLLRDAPLGIVSRSPSIMDLVRCDGAALLYQNRVYRLGTAPSEANIRTLADWLVDHHMDSTGLGTDSLADAGFPGAAALGDEVCGMAAARISAGDVLFWFRSHTAAEIRWGGAKHEAGERDDGRRMHPRSSFKAFLEVVKTRSLPWKDYEMDAIHSLQLILRGAFADGNGGGRRKSASSAIDSRIGELRLDGMAELQALTNEMVRLIETATVPILAVDVHGLVNGWNLKIAELTGLPVASAIGKHLLSLVDESSMGVVERMLQLALAGREEQNVQFQMKTHGGHGGGGARRDPVILVVNACASRDVQENVVGVCFVAQDVTSEKQVMDKFTRIEGDYRAIVRNPSPLIPPIFGTDEFGWCSEWNPAMTKLTGWEREEVIDRMLLGEVFGSNHAVCCRVKNQEALVNLSVLINNAMTGQAAEQVPFAFVSRRGGKHVACLLTVSKKLDADGINVTGVFCFLQTASNELQQVMHVQRLSEQSASKKLKALSYIRHEIRNPLSGILYTRQMLDGTELDSEQQRLLTTANKCHHLLNKILDDIDIESIMDSCLELEMTEFFLRDVLLTAISQVMIPSRSKGIRVVQDLDDDILNEQLYGDSLRLQQIIGDFLLISVKFSPCGTLVEVAGTLSKDRLGANLHVANLELKITHTAGSVPENLLSQMFGAEEEASEEGISLLVCRKLLRLMNGDVRYIREAGKSSFIVSVELASANKSRGARMMIA